MLIVVAMVVTVVLVVIVVCDDGSGSYEYIDHGGNGTTHGSSEVDNYGYGGSDCGDSGGGEGSGESGYCSNGEGS